MIASIILTCALTMVDLDRMHRAQVDLLSLRVHQSIIHSNIGKFWEKGDPINAKPKYKKLLEDQQAAAREISKKISEKLEVIFYVMEETKETCK